jgi:hypothetical protein
VDGSNITNYIRALEEKQDLMYGRIFWRAIAILSLIGNALMIGYLWIR